MGVCDAGDPDLLPAALYDVRAMALLQARAATWLAARGGGFPEAVADATLRVIRRRYPDVHSIVVVTDAQDPATALLLRRRLEPFYQVHLRARANGDRVVPTGSASAVWVIGAGGAEDALIAALNRSSIRVLALGGPPGLDLDTGAATAAGVSADATLALVALPRGVCTGAAFDRRGVLYFDDLGVATAVYQGVAPVAYRLGAGTRLARRPCHLDTHKGDAGAVLIAGGGPGMPGAARLAAEAATVAGAGKVVVVAHAHSQPGLNVGAPDLIVQDSERLAELVATTFQATAVGMGLGQDPWAAQVWSTILATRGPLVVDGDALRLLAACPLRRDDFVLTPHPGEAAALLRCSPRDIQRDRYQAVVRIAETYGGVCVLKGAGTLISGPGGALAVCDRALLTLARAGTGDVLAGLVAGLMAQGLPAFDAAAAAVLAHADGGARLARGAPLADLLAGARQWLNSHL